MFPEDAGFQSCLFIFIHSKKYMAWMTECCSLLSTYFNFEETILLNNRLRVDYAATFYWIRPESAKQKPTCRDNVNDD